MHVCDDIAASRVTIITVPLQDYVPSGIFAGVQLDDGRAERGGAVNDFGRRLDEQRHKNAGLGQRRADFADSAGVRGHIQPALGRQFLALLRHQAAVVGPDIERDGEHLARRRHLQVQVGRDLFARGMDIGVLNMAAVFAQVHRHTVGAGAFDGLDGAAKIGVRRAPRLAQRRHMVNVDAEGRRELFHRLRRSRQVLQVIEYPPRLEVAVQVVVNHRAQQAFAFGQDFAAPLARLAAQRNQRFAAVHRAPGGGASPAQR